MGQNQSQFLTPYRVGAGEWLLIHTEVCTHGNFPVACHRKEVTKSCEGILPWPPASWFPMQAQGCKRKGSLCGKEEARKGGEEEAW